MTKKSFIISIIPDFMDMISNKSNIKHRNTLPCLD